MTDLTTDGPLALPDAPESDRLVTAIHLLATRVADDLKNGHGLFDVFAAEDCSVCQAHLYGDIPAVSAKRDGVIVMMINQNLSPVQQLRALLAEVEARLGFPE